SPPLDKGRIKEGSIEKTRPKYTIEHPKKKNDDCLEITCPKRKLSCGQDFKENKYGDISFVGSSALVLTLLISIALS
ncbi:MAG: hypothetical protein ABII96_01770, partial [Candidatus Zixiibacteriota bacterium]